MRKNFKNLISPWVQCTSITNRVLAHLTVLGLIPTVWGKISKISYLREFSAQVSQIVFLAHLTVLRFIITVWRKTSKISYLREFSAKVSQIVFSFTLIADVAITFKLINSFWHFGCMATWQALKYNFCIGGQKFQKSHISVIL